MIGNRAASLDFRDRVVSYLTAAGLSAQPVSPSAGRVSTIAGRSSVIEWLPVTVMCRVDSGRLDMSGALLDAEALADERGSDRFVAVVKRPDRAVEDTLAVMPLRVLAEVLLDLGRGGHG